MKRIHLVITGLVMAALMACQKEEIEIRQDTAPSALLSKQYKSGIPLSENPEMEEVRLPVGKGMPHSGDLGDNRATPKPKSYVTHGGGWSSKKTYEYDETGRINKVHWVTETPFLRQGTDTYYYDASGQVERINRYSGRDDYYYYENGRIIRSETIQDGVLKSYSEYDYDPAGNVGAQALYHRNPYTGEMAQSYIFIYLYFNDGNIYKQLTYLPASGAEEPELHSTRTYDNYTDTLNPFPMIEILPNAVAQKHLPGTFRIEENGVDLQYRLSYEFDENGVLVKRVTTGPGGTEATVYEYY